MYGVPDFIINILCSIFSNSLAKVYFNGCFSQSCLLRRGTRQGGILSAYLFNIYIDSILSRFFCVNNGCILGINKVNIQAYADDIVLLSPTRQELQFLINQIAIDYNAHCLEVNTKKTVFMVFSNTMKTNDKILSVHFNNIQLELTCF